MNRFTPALFTAALLLAAPAARADTAHAERDAVAIGYTLHRFQDDFATGLSLTSPSFAGGALRLTLGGGVAWTPHAITGAGDQDWARYGETRLVLEGGLRAPGSPVRLYGFGGPLVLLLPDRVADERVAVGGIGGFGFEYFFMREGRDGPVSYFTELGGSGTGARADNLPGRPLLANGFAITVGFRWSL